MRIHTNIVDLSLPAASEICNSKTSYRHRKRAFFLATNKASMTSCVLNRHSAACIALAVWPIIPTD